MSSNKVLCICYKCKTKNSAGRYVSPSTKWRHMNKEKSNRYILNDNDDDNYETNRFAFISLLV
jgi:hypothetical protein